MPPIFAIVGMLTQALDVVGKFSGNAAVAKTTGYVQDAVSVIGALTPLVQDFAGGKEVTLEDARQSLAGVHESLAEFDKLIAEKAANAPGT